LPGEAFYGDYQQRVLNLFANCEAVMYPRVFKKHWDNDLFARMRRNYYKTDWENATCEVYIPTFEDMESNMKYYRIIVKVQPKLDRDIWLPQCRNNAKGSSHQLGSSTAS